jgi:4-amino-4-deoxy-L-arabinose transferase-like glycosyltransferase
MTAPSPRLFRRSPGFGLAIVIALATCLFFPGLGRLPLIEPDEGRNAEVAREMLATQDWLVPHFDGLPYLDKPAAFFWVVAGSFRLFGLSEWAARLPAALCGVGTCCLVWLLARRLFDHGTALRAGIIWSTSPLAFALARIAGLDMMLTLLVTLAMVCFVLVEASGYQRPGLQALMFLFMGLATMTKGPVGFLLPLLSIAAYLALRGELHRLKRLRWGVGALVFFIATLPWFIAVSIRHPDFPRYAFWNESLLRFATGGHLRRRAGPLYYVPVYLAGFLPWSFFLAFAAWRRLEYWRALRGNPRLALLASWSGVIFLFFSISRSKLPGYFLPCTVPLSVMLARVWSETSQGGAGARRPDWVTAGFAALAGLGLLVAVAGQAFRFHSAQQLVSSKLPDQLVAYLTPHLVYTGLILAGLGVLGRTLLGPGRRTAPLAFALAAATTPLLALRWMKPLAIYAETFSSRPLAITILHSPPSSFPVYGYYYFRTGLPFYLRRNVGLVTSAGVETTSNYVVSQFTRLHASRLNPPVGGGAGETLPLPVLINDQEFVGILHQPAARLLLLVRNDHVQALMQEAGNLQPLWTAWQYSVWEYEAEAAKPHDRRLGADRPPLAMRH